MRSKLLIFAFVAALILPVVVWFAVTWDYARLDRLRQAYECYPFDMCAFDLNSDGIPERVETTQEPRSNDPYHSRLKVMLSDERERSALDVEYVHVDNTFRTHLAYFEESGIRKVTIYDNVNPQQFYYWDGSNLVPSASPTYFETQVWAAMGLGDDTGGFHARIVFDFVFVAFCVAYYLLLVIATVIYLVWRKRRMTK